LNSLQCWQHDVKALEKYPRPEGLVTPLVESAVTSEKCGLKVLSASQINPGKPLCLFFAIAIDSGIQRENIK
jgi:hypothetical protein